MTRSDARAIVSALKSQPAFSACDRRDLQDLAEHAEQSSVPAHWPLIHQQTPADACYVILDGEATVTVGGKQVATISAGAVVGETGIAGHKLRNASVTSITALELLHIGAEDFITITERRPALKAVLLARTKDAADATAQS
jgi:CRP/FNR family cyclic AMP-dependent transcriptional regulator